MEVTTNTLLNRIMNGKDLPKELEKNRDVFEEISVSEYLKKLCENQGLVPAQVIKRAQPDRT